MGVWKEGWGKGSKRGLGVFEGVTGFRKEGWGLERGWGLGRGLGVGWELRRSQRGLGVLKAKSFSTAVVSFFPQVVWEGPGSEN